MAPKIADKIAIPTWMIFCQVVNLLIRLQFSTTMIINLDIYYTPPGEPPSPPPDVAVATMYFEVMIPCVVRMMTTL